MMIDKLKSFTQIDQIPGVSVVVIGLNVEQFLSSCLQSIYNLDYPREFLEVIYVDSGSKDKTLDILKRFPSVKVIKLRTHQPNAAKGRNAGWQAAKHDLVQFVDADSYLDTRWLRTAIPQLKENVAAVAGTLRERFPGRNLYHRMANLEWNIRIGTGGCPLKISKQRPLEEMYSFAGKFLKKPMAMTKTWLQVKILISAIVFVEWDISFIDSIQ